MGKKPLNKYSKKEIARETPRKLGLSLNCNFKNSIDFSLKYLSKDIF